MTTHLRTLAAARLDALVRQAAQDPEVPSVMAMVVAPSIDLHWSASLGGPRAAANPPPGVQTPFRIASVTKVFVAAAVLRLVEDGLLRLEAPVADHLSPDHAAMLAAASHDPRRITLDHLLTHTSGLPDHASAPAYAQAVLAHPRRRWSRTEQLALALELQPVGEGPGQRFHYSDTGYVLLGEAIERATEQPLGVAVRRLLGYDRLGLHRTWWEDDEPAPAGAGTPAPQWLGATEATGFDASFDRYGGGGIVSTVGDLVRFARALFGQELFERPGTLAAGCIVVPCAREGIARLHSRLAAVMPMGPAQAWGHLGFWGCGVAHCPSLDLTVAATVNQPLPAEVAWRAELVPRLGAAAASAMLEGGP